MINKRSNVFETNSSSVHTVKIDTGNVNDLVVEKDGYIHLSMPYYGKTFDQFNNSFDKLCYAILVVCYTHHIYLDWCPRNEEHMDEQDYEDEMNYWKDSLDDLTELDEFREIQECVITELDGQNRICYGIKIHQSECGIDHQSQEHESIYEFLEENKLESIRDFIFGCYTLNTGCD